LSINDNFTVIIGIISIYYQKNRLFVRSIRMFVDKIYRFVYTLDNFANLSFFCNIELLYGINRFNLAAKNGTSQ